ncbi:Uncharacterised protein [Mycobacterium tuberculosis]|nr:Uncharacterised protein [Mycobacterium tuberculosis]CNN06749.1 Uncharacterised protein [Mycobacterium tuberculosis]CNN10246.1 Uncharacterised protein [Mycobacterium tuberculosis]CNN28063.1 Uncharacterised protein [Mycobacterium tuberculosis]COX73181.1 Uncharacterised protein [Mycobacterium tuberculosis]
MPCSGRREFRNSSVRSVVVDASGEMAPAIGSRFLARPLTSCCSWSTLAENCALFASTVASTALRLVITSPISWSRAPSAAEKAPVSASTFANGPPWPCSNSMTALVMVLILSASKPFSTGRSPPSNASRSSAGWVWATLMVPPGGSLRSSPGPDVISRNRSPTRFSYRITARVDEYSV